MVCKNCGFEIDGDTAFCPSCGAVVQEQAGAQEESAPEFSAKMPSEEEILKRVKEKRARLETGAASESLFQSIGRLSGGMSMSETADLGMEMKAAEQAGGGAPQELIRSKTFVFKGKPVKNNSESLKRVTQEQTYKEMKNLRTQIILRNAGETIDIKKILIEAADKKLKAARRKEIFAIFEYTDKYNATRINALRAYEEHLGSFGDINAEIRARCDRLWEELEALRGQLKAILDEFPELFKMGAIGSQEAQYNITRYRNKMTEYDNKLMEMDKLDSLMIDNMMIYDFNTTDFKFTTSHDKRIRRVPPEGMLRDTAKMKNRIMGWTVVICWLMLIATFTGHFPPIVKIFNMFPNTNIGAEQFMHNAEYMISGVIVLTMPVVLMHVILSKFGTNVFSVLVDMVKSPAIILAPIIAPISIAMLLGIGALAGFYTGWAFLLIDTVRLIFGKKLVGD